MARYVATMLNGVGVQAANGASRTEMTCVIEFALRGLPWRDRSAEETASKRK